MADENKVWVEEYDWYTGFTFARWLPKETKRRSMIDIILSLIKELFKMKNVKFASVSEYADIMSLSDWDYSVKCRLFIPDDGIGYWMKDSTTESNVSCWDPRPSWATHVAWYNN